MIWRRTRASRWSRWGLYHLEVDWTRREVRGGGGWLIARALCGRTLVHVIGSITVHEMLDIDSVDGNGARAPEMRRVVCAHCLRKVRRIALVTDLSTPP